MTAASPSDASKRVSSRLRRSVSYIERNIENRVALADVASEAALSQYHFHRQFRSQYGISVMDYIRRRRLAGAAQRLIETKAPIIEIAMDAGFESQSAFTRAFRRMFFMSPGAYRTQNRHVPWLCVEAIDEETLACLPGLGATSPKQLHIDEIRIVGLASTYTGDERPAIPDQWIQLASHVGGTRFLAGERFGISDARPNAANGKFRYIAGIAARAEDTKTTVLTPFTIPAGQYAVFDFCGQVERFPAVIDYLFGVWMPGSNLRLRPSPSFERYPRGFIPGILDSFEIWMPVE